MSHGVFHKVPNEKEFYGVDMADRLDAEETLSNPVVTVLLLTAAGWSDVTSEFLGTPGPTINGTIIGFWLKAREQAAHQAPGVYAVEAKAQTSTNKVVVGKDRDGYLPRLIVREA